MSLASLLKTTPMTISITMSNDITFSIGLLNKNIIWDPAVLLLYSTTSGRRRHRGRLGLQGAELRLVSCLVTEIFY